MHATPSSPLSITQTLQSRAQSWLRSLSAANPARQDDLAVLIRVALWLMVGFALLEFLEAALDGITALAIFLDTWRIGNAIVGMMLLRRGWLRLTSFICVFLQLIVVSLDMTLGAEFSMAHVCEIVVIVIVAIMVYSWRPMLAVLLLCTLATAAGLYLSTETEGGAEARATELSTPESAESAAPAETRESILAFVVRTELQSYLALYVSIGMISTVFMKRIRDALHTKLQLSNTQLAKLMELNQSVAVTLELDPLLNMILEKLGTVLDFDSACIRTVQPDDATRVTIIAVRGVTGANALGSVWDYAPARGAYADRLFAQHLPIVLSNTHEHGPYESVYRAIYLQKVGGLPAYANSAIEVPLLVRDRVIGTLLIEHHTRGFYHEEHALLAFAFGLNAANALENARLYRENARAVALAERNRLARDLHDSVAQVLFASTLMGQTARQLAEKDLAQALPIMDKSLSLVHDGLAELRALIFELRPEVLTDEGLLVALQKQVALLSARHEARVDIALGDVEPVLSMDAKEAMYRIALEALQNAFKHSQATHITVRLAVVGEDWRLSVNDNGAGFDPRQAFAGHLGLISMRERAEGFGGTVAITSTPGHGATVVLSMPAVARTVSAQPVMA